MTTRRDFVKTLTVCGSLLAIPVSLRTDVLAQEKLPRRKIPGTNETLPIIGLGTSNFFRRNDVPSKEIRGTKGCRQMGYQTDIRCA